MRVRVEIFAICVAKCYLTAAVARKIAKTIVAIKLNLAAFVLRIAKWMETTRMVIDNKHQERGHNNICIHIEFTIDLEGEGS